VFINKNISNLSNQVNFLQNFLNLLVKKNKVIQENLKELDLV